MLDINKVKAMMQRAEAKQFQDEDYEFVQAVADSYAYIAELAREPGMTTDRLWELCLGSDTAQP